MTHHDPDPYVDFDQPEADEARRRVHRPQPRRRPTEARYRAQQ